MRDLGIRRWYGSANVRRLLYFLNHALQTSIFSLKWKPPSENSVDFKLELRFPPSKGAAGGVDFYAKPQFTLLQWCGANKYEYYDVMSVSDEEWEK